jgi:hypothetical protein
MTARNRGEPKFPLPLLLLFFTVSVLMLDALTSYAKSAGEILSDYGRLPGEERVRPTRSIRNVDTDYIFNCYLLKIVMIRECHKRHPICLMF